MFHPTRRFLVLALTAIAVMIVAGCSSLPTQPPGPASDSRAANPALLGLSPGDNTSTSPSTAPTGSTTGAVSATSSKTINGLLGGTITAGRFTVIVPPAAFFGTATVTVNQPDVSKLQVSLSISPADKNHFLLPVLLVADGSSMNPQLLSAAFISWYNPATGQWVPVAGSSVSLLNLTVTAPLLHFSQYRVDTQSKAGW